MTEKYEQLDWEVEFDDGEEVGGSYRLLDEGYYPFEVMSAKKGFTNSEPPTKCIDLTLKVGVKPDVSIVTDRIAMHSGMKWKLSQLAVSLGVRKHGEKCTFSPADTAGMTGWLEIDHREYIRKKDGNGKKAGDTDYANNVARYIDPDDAPESAGPAKKNEEDPGW